MSAQRAAKAEAFETIFDAAPLYYPAHPLPPAHEPIGARDLFSLYSLIGHVAHAQGIKAETLQGRIQDVFGVDHICKIVQGDFAKAMEMLAELRFDGMRSRR